MSDKENLVKKVINYLKEKAKQFGAEEGKDYIFRNKTSDNAFKDNGAFFGFIRPEEEGSGQYHDFSYVVFPSDPNDEEANYWVVCLGIGTLGFRNDYDLAQIPGVRRLFRSIIKSEDSFCKSDFTDLETGLPKQFLNNNKIASIKKTLKRYEKVLPVCQIIEEPKIDANGGLIEDNESFDFLVGFLAAYAKIREWASSQKHRKNIEKAINKIKAKEYSLGLEEIKKILEQRKYIILEGAPGTGKTRMAHILAEKLNAKTFFTQFHAETSYSDFIWGLRPKLNTDQLLYEEVEGVFTKAIRYAINNQNENEKVILIIDEINRANLSNVLGPIFYLFEYQREKSEIEIEITPKFSVKKLPKNFYVIATMNTADRSLAVVDFALRRRFAWITLKPQIIPPKNKKEVNKAYYEIENDLLFFKEDFDKFEEIFQWYASDNELNLQPGQAYFIARNDDEMKNRITYELYPLIKEYLQEGLLLSAKEEFNSYFYNRINRFLFE